MRRVMMFDWRRSDAHRETRRGARTNRCQRKQNPHESPETRSATAKAAEDVAASDHGLAVSKRPDATIGRTKPGPYRSLGSSLRVDHSPESTSCLMVALPKRVQGRLFRLTASLERFTREAAGNTEGSESMARGMDRNSTRHAPGPAEAWGSVGVAIGG